MRRTSTTDDLYFVTLTVVGWIDIFSRKVYKDYIIENLEYCIQHKGLQLTAYVIMSNHVHLMAAVQNGNMSDWLRDFKSFTSKGLYNMIHSNNESRKEWMIKLFEEYGKENEANKGFQVWQNGSYPTILYPNQTEIIMQKIDYIHQNPVRAGIVPEADMYIYSSAHAQNPLRRYCM